MANAIHFADSDRLCAYLAERTDGVSLLSFSCGKDSIGAWLQMRRYFTRIIPVYLYLVPGLQFIEDALRYYEDFFGTHIYRMPHPSLYRKLNNFVFQPPDRIRAIQDLNLVDFEKDDVFDIVKAKERLPFRAVYTGVGVRAVDSLNRWASIKTHGPINENRMNFYPIYDWRKERLLTEIMQAGIKLPPEYRAFGRTFDGLDYRFLKPLKDYFPADYARLLEFFPLMEVELLRYEARQALYD